LSPAHHGTEPVFDFRRIVLRAYGPSLLLGISNGAILPIIALSARELGSSVALAALIVSLIGMGAVAGSLPAALIISRYGERRALVASSWACAGALLICFFVSHILALVAGIFLYGLASSVFNLARQAHIIEIVPIHMKARGLASLGGAERIGIFLGPFAAAAIMESMGLSAAYWVAAIAMAAAGTLCWTLRQAPNRPAIPAAVPRAGLAAIARSHARMFLTLGAGVLLISSIRASRPLVIPLWADHIGISPPTMSLVFGIASAIDMLAFYPAGKIMDRYGRRWIAIPSALILGASMLLLPYVSDLTGFVLACVAMGLGNGIGAGMVMTIGADASPVEGRTEFLGIWKLLDDIGLSLGPVILSSCTVLFSLGAGIALMGLGGMAAGTVFWRYLPSRKPA